LVVANAGNHIPSDPLNFDAEQYKQLMEVNYFGFLHTLQMSLPLLRKTRSPRIVGISSLAGFRGLPTSAAYGASKAAMTLFLESARFHFEDAGIHTTIVHPGFVKTPLTDKNDFPMPFLIDAEKAAKIICTGISKGKKEIAFPIPFSWFVKALRLLPYPIYEYFVRTFVWKPYQRIKK
ncbi:MAG: SDR family NAD(P)-dependent oxidoreductase, partial [Bdellovibrionales bacterium]|nr:SDR family NAD(P)-dependent oxidoreductase [Bdellovibrionales bacterium]